MDKQFLSALLNRTASRKDVDRENDRNTENASPRASATHATLAGAPSSVVLAGLGTVISVPYAGRAPETLFLDASSCDVVILVGDEVNYARALPAHQEVLRARNAGGYFTRLFADPASFPEYSEQARGFGAEAAEGELARKPMIRRLHWRGAVASAMLSFLYRDYCELPWVAVPDLRCVGEEIGARGLCDAVDYLLNPQHLLPWTVGDLRAAGLALQRAHLVEAADKYAMAMKVTGCDVTTRLSSVVYVTRQAPPKLSISMPTSSSTLPAIDRASPAESPSTLSPTGGGGGITGRRDVLRIPSIRASLGAAFASNGLSGSASPRNGSLYTPASIPTSTGSGAGGYNSGSNNSSSSSINGRISGNNNGSSIPDSRLGWDIVDGVLRSIAVDSKVLRTLLLPGRRRDIVLLYGSLMGRTASNQSCSLSSLAAMSNVGGGFSGVNTSGGDPVLRRPSSTHILATPAPNRSSSSPSIGVAGGAVAASTRKSFELPQVVSRFRSSKGFNASLGSRVNVETHGSQDGRGGGGGDGGCSSIENSAVGTYQATAMGELDEQYGPHGSTEPIPAPINSSTSVKLMVIVPSAHLATALAALVARPLTSHGLDQAGTSALLKSGPGSGVNGIGDGTGIFRKDIGEWRSSGTNTPLAAQLVAAPAFDPFGKLCGIPGLAWGSCGDKSSVSQSAAGCAPVPSASASPQHQPRQRSLPAPISPGSYDQISLAIAMDTVATVAAAGSGNWLNGNGDGATETAVAAATVSAAAAAAAAGTRFSASRLFSSVLAALGAADNPQYIIRPDPGQAEHAAAMERRRATADVVTSVNTPAVSGSSGGGSGGGGGLWTASAPGSGSSSGSLFNNMVVAACAARTVLGSANPRDYLIPLPDNATGAISITLPVGLVLGDPASLEALTTPQAGFGAFLNGTGSNRNNAFMLALRAVQTEGVSGGGGGNVSPRVAALMPHLLASALALSHVLSAVGLVSQVLQVVAEQHGLFSIPVLRASLRISNPSAAMLTVLAQTNTSFAISPGGDSTIHVRKPLADIVRLLQVLHSTLPAKQSWGGGGGGGGAPASCAGSNCSLASGSMQLGGDGTCSDVIPRLLRPTAGFGAAVTTSVEGSSRSLDIGRARSRTASGFTAMSTPTSAAAVAGASSAAAMSTPTLAAAAAGALTSPPSLTRRMTSSDFQSSPRPANSVSVGSLSYSYGVPYNQLERLFPGWHLYVVELSPGAAPVEEC